MDLNWKNHHGLFSLWSAQLSANPSPSPHVSRPASHYRVAVANRQGPPVSSIFPQIFPCSAPCVLTDKIPVVEPATRSVLAPPHCPPAIMSHRIGCGAPWRPITVAHYSTAARRCSTRDAHARSSTMRSRASSLVPPRPILSLLADDCGLYHHLTSVAPSPFLRPVESLVPCMSRSRLFMTTLTGKSC
jgi:hypothetical protein